MGFWKIDNPESFYEIHTVYNNEDKLVVRIDDNVGSIIVKTTDNNPPIGIDEDNIEGVELFCLKNNVEEIIQVEKSSCFHGYYFENVSDEEQSEILDGLRNEDEVDFLVYKLGWQTLGAELWLHGPLSIKKETKNIAFYRGK